MGTNSTACTLSDALEAPVQVHVNQAITQFLAGNLALKKLKLLVILPFYIGLTKIKHIRKTRQDRGSAILHRHNKACIDSETTKYAIESSYLYI